MDIIIQIFMETVRVFNESAIYILFGFFIAGILHSFVTPEKVTRYLGRKNARSVILASLFGVPLPLCSCSVLPTAISLRKQGASRGATLSFLISTPETGADSISLTYALMDPLMTVFRPLAAVITAMTAGLTANFLERKRDKGKTPDAPAEQTEIERQEIEQFEASLSHTDHCHSDCCTEHTTHGRGVKHRLEDLFRYAYGELLDDIAAWLMISLVLAGAISALIPESVFENYLGSGIASMLVMLVVGIPLYMCAASSTPVAAALIMKGLNPGAALVFLLAGPATNAGTVLLVGRFLGRKMLAIYIGTIAIVSLLLGSLLNSIYLDFNIDPVATMGSATELFPEWLKIGASIVLLLLIVRRFRGLTPETLHKSTQEKLHDLFGYSFQLKESVFVAIWKAGRLGFRYAPALLLLCYVLSGFYTVSLGEKAMKKRFGKVVQRDIGPGLHYRFPFPFETTDIDAVSEIRRIEIGLRSGPGETSISNAAALKRQLLFESESLTGDENIVNMLFTIQYSIDDFFNYRYKIDNQDALVKDLSETIIRQVLGGNEIDYVLTNGRIEIESRVKSLLQSSLDRHETGIGVVQVSILNDHAPVNVHAAFRDVASAEEDKNTRINQAYAYRNATLAKARGKAAKMLEDARSYQEEKTNRALGEAHNFTLQVDAYQRSREVTEIRLYLETMERNLGNVNKFIKPPKGTARSLELWFQNNEDSNRQGDRGYSIQPLRSKK